MTNHPLSKSEHIRLEIIKALISRHPTWDNENVIMRARELAKELMQPITEPSPSPCIPTEAQPEKEPEGRPQRFEDWWNTAAPGGCIYVQDNYISAGVAQRIWNDAREGMVPADEKCGAQCPVVHEFADSLLEVLGVPAIKDALSVVKSIAICEAIKELQAKTEGKHDATHQLALSISRLYPGTPHYANSHMIYSDLQKAGFKIVREDKEGA